MIKIDFIPHKEQRIPGQIGDWFFDQKADLVIRVSDLGDWRYNFLVAWHELAEAVLCKHNGISSAQVDDYDLRPAAVTDDPDSFSGYPGAIYQYQHNDALASEWQMARLLGVDWIDYSEAVENLFKS